MTINICSVLSFDLQTHSTSFERSKPPLLTESLFKSLEALLMCFISVQKNAYCYKVGHFSPKTIARSVVQLRLQARIASSIHSGQNTYKIDNIKREMQKLNPITARAGPLWPQQSKIFCFFHDISSRPTKILDFVYIYALIILIKSF